MVPSRYILSLSIPDEIKNTIKVRGKVVIYKTKHNKEQHTSIIIPGKILK